MTTDEKRKAVKLAVKELTKINIDIQKEVDSLSGDDSTWRQRYELCSIILSNIVAITAFQKELDITK